MRHVRQWNDKKQDKSKLIIQGSKWVHTHTYAHMYTEYVYYVIDCAVHIMLHV